MKIRPLQDRIIVQRIEEDETTKGGIIIPDSAKEKPQEGKAIAVGNGKVTEDGKLQPLDVKKGDRLLFSAGVGGRGGVMAVAESDGEFRVNTAAGNAVWRNGVVK